jgi:NAD(P)H dehydrogenase (quinone)
LIVAKIAVVYFSGFGYTHLLAEAVVKGTQQVSEVEVEQIRIVGEQITNGRWQDDAVMTKLNAADAIIFGSPTYMGGVAAQFKAFIDAASSVWFVQGWKDKVAGGFTHSASPSGDKQGTLLYLAINAMQHSMIWVGNAEPNSDSMGKTDGINRLGSYTGVMGQAYADMSGNPPQIYPGDRLTAEFYGKRVAEATLRWK